jgi:hypothetical protein
LNSTNLYRAEKSLGQQSLKGLHMKESDGNEEMKALNALVISMQAVEYCKRNF